MIVLDASAAVELLLRSPAGGRVEALLGGERVVAPAHFDSEILSTISRLVRSRRLEEARARQALDHVALMSVERAALPPLLPLAFALRDRFSAPDSLYVALARERDARLVTADGALSRASEGYVPTELVATQTQ